MAHIVMAYIVMADIGVACTVINEAARPRTDSSDGRSNGHSISASPTACLLRGYGRAGTQNDRLGERPYPRNGNAVGDADIEPT